MLYSLFLIWNQTSSKSLISDYFQNPLYSFTTCNHGTVSERSCFNCTDFLKISVQGVAALCSHFPTLSQELDVYEANYFPLLIFKKERQILFHF